MNGYYIVPIGTTVLCSTVVPTGTMVVPTGTTVLWVLQYCGMGTMGTTVLRTGTI